MQPGEALWADQPVKFGEIKPSGPLPRVSSLPRMNLATLGSLDDDYHEKWNNCCYGMMGLPDFKPGAPYNADSGSMMMSNQYVRSRHYWHYAEWVRSRLVAGKKFDFIVCGLTLRIINSRIIHRWPGIPRTLAPTPIIITTIQQNKSPIAPTRYREGEGSTCIFILLAMTDIVRRCHAS